MDTHNLANNCGNRWSAVTSKQGGATRIDSLQCKTHIIVRTITQKHLVGKGVHA